MEQYEASLARVCLELSGINELYDEQVPEDFKVPSLYFPPKEVDPNASALNSFEEASTLYIQLFASTRTHAEELAHKIVKGIMLKRCRIPVYNVDGTDSGALLKLDTPTARVVDEGVAQITVTYRVHYSFTEASVPKASSVNINMGQKK